MILSFSSIVPTTFAPSKYLIPVNAMFGLSGLAEILSIGTVVKRIKLYNELIANVI